MFVFMMMTFNRSWVGRRVGGEEEEDEE